MQGASGMLSVVQQADGKFQMMSLRDQLGLTPAQKERVRSTSAPPGGSVEPNFWVHFDKDSEEIGITQARPTDDDEHSQQSDDQEGMIYGGEDAILQLADGNAGDASNDAEEPANVARSGAADDAF